MFKIFLNDRMSTKKKFLANIIIQSEMHITVFKKDCFNLKSDHIHECYE
jgi:hypothetical protein